MKCLYFALVVVFWLLTVPGQAAWAEPKEVFTRIGEIEILGSGPSYLELGAGVFDFVNRTKDSAAGMVEFRLGQKLGFIGPAIGLMANSDGGIFGYGAIYADLRWKKLLITPVLGLGAYEKGDSKDLGGTFQFREELGIAYEFAARSRVGIRYAHSSNADLHNRNPGVDEIHLTLAIGF